jgi:hypothetical protein
MVCSETAASQKCDSLLENGGLDVEMGGRSYLQKRSREGADGTFHGD